MQSRKVRLMRKMLGRRSAPLLDSMSAVCKKAVPASQGMREAFSTGSQAQ